MSTFGLFASIHIVWYKYKIDRWTEKTYTNYFDTVFFIIIKIFVYKVNEEHDNFSMITLQNLKKLNRLFEIMQHPLKIKNG